MGLKFSNGFSESEIGILTNLIVLLKFMTNEKITPLINIISIKENKFSNNMSKVEVLALGVKIFMNNPTFLPIEVIGNPNIIDKNVAIDDIKIISETDIRIINNLDNPLVL